MVVAENKYHEKNSCHKSGLIQEIFFACSRNERRAACCHYFHPYCAGGGCRSEWSFFRLASPDWSFPAFSFM